jgi:hypothetical protein
MPWTASLVSCMHSRSPPTSPGLFCFLDNSRGRQKNVSSVSRCYAHLRCCQALQARRLHTLYLAKFFAGVSMSPAGQRRHVCCTSRSPPASRGFVLVSELAPRVCLAPASSMSATPSPIPVAASSASCQLPLRTINVVRFSQAPKMPPCDLVQDFKCSVSPSSSTSGAKRSCYVTCLHATHPGIKSCFLQISNIFNHLLFPTRFPSSATSGASSVFPSSRRDTSSDRVQTAIHLQFRQVKQTPLLNINSGLLLSSRQNE